MLRGYQDELNEQDAELWNKFIREPMLMGFRMEELTDLREAMFLCGDMKMQELVDRLKSASIEDTKHEDVDLKKTNAILIETAKRNLELIEKSQARNVRYRNKIEELEKTIKTQQSTWQKKLNKLNDKKCRNCKHWHPKRFCKLYDLEDEEFYCKDYEDDKYKKEVLDAFCKRR